MTKAYKKIEWKARFDAWKTSGLTVAAWCRKQEVNIHQMYYWFEISKVMKPLIKEPIPSGTEHRFIHQSFCYNI